LKRLKKKMKTNPPHKVKLPIKDSESLCFYGSTIIELDNECNSLKTFN
jgi:hypothetical protein